MISFTSAQTILRKHYYCTVTSGSKRGLYNMSFKPEDWPEKNFKMEDLTQQEIIEYVEKREEEYKEMDEIFEGMNRGTVKEPDPSS